VRTIAALLIATPAWAWCGNTATNCGAGVPVYYRQPTLEEKIEEAQYEIERLKRKVSDLEADVEILKRNAP